MTRRRVEPLPSPGAWNQWYPGELSGTTEAFGWNPLPDPDPTANARGQTSADVARRVARAQVLNAAGMSKAQIGVRIAFEEGRKRPYSARSAWRWLKDRPKR